MSDWISVVDRFPSFGIPVLVVAGGVVQYVVYSLGTGGWYPKIFNGDMAPLGAFTHWMPLPPSPTSKFARSYISYEESFTDKRFINPVSRMGIFDSEEHYQNTVKSVEDYRKRRTKQISEEGDV